MFIRFDSLRNRLLLTFLGFTTITIIVALISLWFYDKTTRLANVTSNIEASLMKTLHLIKIEQDFFNNESNNSQFYQSGKSKYLNHHQTLLDEVKTKLYNLLNLDGMKQLSADTAIISEDIKHIIQELENYEREFQKLVKYTIERGFEDYGVEGKMRQYVQELEKNEKILNVEKLFFLRKLEKDYLLRKDSSYALQVEQICAELKTKNEDTNNIIEAYLQNFKRLVALEFLIGTTSSTGTRAKMRFYADNTANFMEKLVLEINRDVILIEAFQFKVFMFIIFFMVFLSILMSYFIAGVITHPLSRLSVFIRQTVENRFAEETILPVPNSKDEIGGLTHDFNLMLQELRLRLREVDEKTQALEHQNEELNVVNQQLTESEKRLTQVNSVKDKLFSIISHDLRSPLNSMLGFLQVLENQADIFTPEETRHFSLETQKSVNRLVRLLDNLLQWSLSQTGEIEFNPNDLNVKEIIRENIELYRKTAQDKSIDLQAISPDNCWVKADSNMLNFILRNLISNAIKFSHPGAIIQIMAENKRTEIEFTVKDQGVGMPSGHIHKIIDSGEHVTTIGTNAEKGTGFGLLLVKSFVEKNKGKFWIESEMGKGTSIKFTLVKVN